MGDLVTRVRELLQELEALSIEKRAVVLNDIRRELHKYSPFAAHPTDCVLWVPAEHVHANDYNPNVVAAPEMRLLNKSIEVDGYTMPIVTWEVEPGVYEIVDGFHRHRVGRENKRVAATIHGHLPITVIANTERTSRMAATIRHNRARGKHTVDGMAEIVLDLSRRNWSDQKIAEELGMEPDEVLRLRQITGLAEIFADQEFSEAWEAE